MRRQVVTTVARRSRQVLTAATLVLVGLLPAGAHPAGAATATALLRVGHFANGVASIDVYIDGAAASGNVAFEQVTAYSTLAPGTHTLAARTAGSPATATPLVDTTVSVAAGTATTVALVQDPSGLAAHVYLDDLSAPPSGQAKLRIIPAISGQPQLDVYAAPSTTPGQPPSASTNSNGLTLSAPAQHPLFSAATYATATPYQAVPAGTYDVQVRATADAQLLLTGRNWPVLPGTVASIVVLTGPSGPTLEVIRDAAGAASMPAGGLKTGEGGTAGRGHGSALPWELGLAGPGVLALAGAGFRARRRALTAGM